MHNHIYIIKRCATIKKKCILYQILEIFLARVNGNFQ